MTTISSVSKVGYIYNEATTTWHPIAGSANTSLDYEWSGAHDFANDVTFLDVVNAKAGVNNFQNPAARDAAISLPVPGLVCFLRQDASGNTINQIQYYSGGAWKLYSDVQLVAKVANHVIQLHDSGKTITVDSSTATTITVPTNATTAFPLGSVITIIQTGSGQVSFVEASGVTIRSKSSYKKIGTQYAAAQLVKVDTDIWILIGDLKA